MENPVTEQVKKRHEVKEMIKKKEVENNNNKEERREILTAPFHLLFFIIT